MIAIFASLILSVLLSAFINPGFRGEVPSAGLVIRDKRPPSATTSSPDEPYYTIVPQAYCCMKTGETISVDGRMDEAAWQRAPWTERFTDIEGATRPVPRYSTRVKMLWDQTYFYIYAELEDPHVWGSLTKRDTVIFNDNDFEIFVCPSGNNHTYYELEMNALNTVWDLYLPMPYRDGGKADNSWDIEGLLSAVQVRGTLNDPSDVDQGWSVEVAIPWASFIRHGELRGPVYAGKTWRVNFSRVQWQHTVSNGTYKKVPDTKEDNWVWSAQGVVDMHRPEKWGWVRFAEAEEKCEGFGPDKEYPYTMGLLRLYWAQKEFRGKHKRWARSFDELGISAESMRIEEWIPELNLTYNGFLMEYAVLSEQHMDTKTWILFGIDEESKMSRKFGFDKLFK